MAGAGPALGRIHVPVEGAEKGRDVPLAPPGSSLRAPGATSFDAHSLSAASHALELGQGRGENEKAWGGNEKAWSGRAAGPRALWGRSRHPRATPTASCRRAHATAREQGSGSPRHTPGVTRPSVEPRLRPERGRKHRSPFSFPQRLKTKARSQGT